MAVYVDAWGVIQAIVQWVNADRSITESIPVYYMKATLPSASRNFTFLI